MNHMQIREPTSFGNRNTSSTVTVTKNGKVRQFTVNPILVSVAAFFVFTLIVGYFVATAYLMFRDDIVGASYAREARLKHEYEDRIAALRSKLDRITSRQLLDQQAIETRVRALMDRQEILGERDGQMSKLLKKATARGLAAGVGTIQVPVPTENPVKTNESNRQSEAKSSSVQPDFNLPRFASAFSLRGTQEELLIADSSIQKFGVNFGPNDFTSRLFGNVAESISDIDDNQRRKVHALRVAAIERTDKIANVLKSLGVHPNIKTDTGIGGPFVPMNKSVDFDAYMDALEDSLKQYDAITAIAKGLPLGQPVRTGSISSGFGSRKDPFNGRHAMHSGIDYKVPRGTPVYATGAGQVVRAGRNGGYGKLVEVRHRDGLVTRYAHLSRIKVRVGQQVTAGQLVGKVGSTGRSTGPHLHYEVRRGTLARNPSKYIQAGKKVHGFL